MKKKIRFYRNLLLEIIETLRSICLYLECDGRRGHNPAAVYMRDHFDTLKIYSDVLRSKK